MMQVAPGYSNPWAASGVTFTEQAPTAEQAMKLAGQDWQVLESKLLVPPTADREGRVAEGYKATVRSDTGDILGIVRDSYKVTQNKLLYDFEAALTDDSGLHYETAGVLSGGKVVWALAQVPKHIRIKGDHSDIIPYLLAWTGHDGSRGFGVGATTIRVVCQNTFHAARTQKDMPRITLRHTAKVEDRIGEARRSLQMTFDYLDTVEVVLNDLAGRKLTTSDFEAFAEKLLPVSDGVKDPWKTIRDRDALTAIYAADSETLDGLRFTSYRALQAVTEFVDHRRTYQTSKGNSADDNRALSLLDGQGARMKQRALALLSN